MISGDYTGFGGMYGATFFVSMSLAIADFDPIENYKHLPSGMLYMTLFLFAFVVILQYMMFMNLNI